MYTYKLVTTRHLNYIITLIVVKVGKKYKTLNNKATIVCNKSIYYYLVLKLTLLIKNW